MPQLTIKLDGDGAFDDKLKAFDKDFIFLEDPLLTVARLPDGTISGKSAVAIGFEHDGKYIVIQTSLALFKSAAKAMETRDEMEGRPI